MGLPTSSAKELLRIAARWRHLCFYEDFPHCLQDLTQPNIDNGIITVLYRLEIVFLSQMIQA